MNYIVQTSRPVTYNNCGVNYYGLIDSGYMSMKRYLNEETYQGIYTIIFKF